MNQAELNALLKQLETAMTEGEEELKERPEQFKLLKSLIDELKRTKPGAQMSQKMANMVQKFFQTDLEESMKEQKAELAQAQKQTGPVAMKIIDAHNSVLNALTTAHQGVAVINPSAPAQLVEATANKMNQANQAAEKKVAEASVAVTAPKIVPVVPGVPQNDGPKN